MESKTGTEPVYTESRGTGWKSDRCKPLKNVVHQGWADRVRQKNTKVRRGVIPLYRKSLIRISFLCALFLIVSISFIVFQHTGTESENTTDNNTYTTMPLRADLIIPSQTSSLKKMPALASEPVKTENSFPYYDQISLEYEMQELVWSASEETGCPYELALSVIFCESSYRNVNGDNGNSIGYMQAQPRWHQERMERLGVTDLSDPLSNFRVGCDLLAELIEKYESVEAALTCYNTGSPGTSDYADRVLAYMNETFFAEEDDDE